MSIKNMVITLKTPPLKQAVTLAMVKDHVSLELSETTEDDYLSQLIRAASKRAESITGRRFITQSYYYYLQQFPPYDYILLPYGKLQSVEGVTYRDSTITTNILSPTLYYVDTDSEPGMVRLQFRRYWPIILLDSKNPVRIEFTCGYGDDPEDVPETIKQAILFLVGHWYANREPFTAGVTPEIGQTFTDILLTERLYWRFY